MIITLFFVLGIIAFAFRICHFAIKMAWGITKIVVYAIGVPIFIIALVIWGLTRIAVPMLVIALLVAFILPRLKQS